MNNLQQPAFPNPWKGQKKEGSDEEVAVITHLQPGFTKLEYAAILITQGMLANPSSDSLTQIDISQTAIRLAKAVIEECNK